MNTTKQGWHKAKARRKEMKKLAQIATIFTVVALLFAAFPPVVYAGLNQSVTRTIEPSDRDSYVNQEPGKQNDNYGAEELIWVISYLSGQPKNQRSFVHFDLSQIPTGSTVTSANLSLYLETVAATNRTYSAHRVTPNDWTETGITWAKYDGITDWTTPGGDFDGAVPTASITGSQSPDWVDWTVTTDVSYFVANPTENYGWCIKDQSEDSTAEEKSSFYAKETAETTKPKLVVIYTAPWDSHKTGPTGPITDNFVDYATEHIVYMRGTGFKDVEYNVVYWDGGGNKRITDGAITAVGGILDSEHTFEVGVDVAGTWYASVYVGATPTEHTDTINLWADDSFTVQQSAIPEFSTVFAAIAVAGLCFGIYYWMRRRRLASYKVTG